MADTRLEWDNISQVINERIAVERPPDVMTFVMEYLQSYMTEQEAPENETANLPLPLLTQRTQNQRSALELAPEIPVDFVSRLRGLYAEMSTATDVQKIYEHSILGPELELRVGGLVEEVMKNPPMPSNRNAIEIFLDIRKLTDPLEINQSLETDMAHSLELEKKEAQEAVKRLADLENKHKQQIVELKTELLEKMNEKDQRIETLEKELAVSYNACKHLTEQTIVLKKELAEIQTKSQKAEQNPGEGDTTDQGDTQEESIDASRSENVDVGGDNVKRFKSDEGPSEN